MNKLTCIDSLHAKGVCNYVQSQGHHALLYGRAVITDCDDDQVMETAAGYGLALIEPANAVEYEAFSKFVGAV